MNDYYVYINRKLKDRYDRPLIIITNEKEHYIFEIALTELGFDKTKVMAICEFYLPMNSNTPFYSMKIDMPKTMTVYKYNFREEYEQRFEIARSLYINIWGGIL